MVRPHIAAVLAWAWLATTAAAWNMTAIPPCAVSCLIASMSETSCDARNSSCLCNDKHLTHWATECVRANCTVKEALVTKRVTWSNCGRPLHDHTKMIEVMKGVLFTLETVFFAARVACKVLKLSGWWWDDTVITMSYIGAVGFLAATFLEQRNGAGKDIWTLSFTQITGFLKIFFIFEALYFFTLATIKASILFFYLRIFPDQKFRVVLWCTQLFNLVCAATFIVIICLQCRPVSHFWDGWDGEHAGYCWDINAIAWAHGGINTGLDVWMLVLPATQIYGLNIQLKKKIWVLAMFGVGIFLTIASSIRLRSIVGFKSTTNVTNSFFLVALWSCIELSVGIVVACLPSFHQLCKRLFPSIGFTDGFGSRLTWLNTRHSTVPDVPSISRSRIYSRDREERRRRPSCAKPSDEGQVERGEWSQISLVKVRSQQSTDSQHRDASSTATMPV